MSISGNNDAVAPHSQGKVGEPPSTKELLALVYDELKNLARRRMAQERPGHTLQATALVHEAYLRLLGGWEPNWSDEAHFFHAAAEAMRRILIEHARSKGHLKRGGGRRRVPLDVLDLAEEDQAAEALAINEVVQKLEQISPTVAQVVKLRFYAGLSEEETAKVLGISSRTVRREWTFGRAWLFRELGYPSA
jgi:RNA polymerase sigma factor (TIGR02999 family)